jgi:hypothetical protein
MTNHYVNKVAELHVILSNKIKDVLPCKGILIEFDEPIVIYQSVWEGDGEVGHIKVPYICKTLKSFEFLGGVDAYDAEFEVVSTIDVEDIMSVAHILDIVTAKKYKILNYV